MSRRSVTQAQIKRAIAAAKASGLTVSGFRAHADGSLDLLIGDQPLTTLPEPAPTSADDLDAEIAEFERAHGYG